MKYPISALLFGAALCSIVSPAKALAATYHVSGQGSDANNGSAAAPFRQIRRAVDIAGPGDTVLVADGSYLGFDVREKNATAAAPLVIRATGTNAVVTPTTDRRDNRDTIFVTYSSYVTVDGFRSSNANRAALRVDESDRITVRNCVFGNNGTWGIFTDFSDDLLLEYNRCFGSVAEHGIYVSNSGDRPIVRGNVCYDNRGCGIQFNADLSAGGDGVISGGLIEDNVCYNNGRGGGAAINLDGVQDTTVRNNLLYNNKATGIVNYQGDGGDGPRGMVIVHNTIDQPSDGRWCIDFGQTTGPNLVRNNIFINRHSFRGAIQYYTLGDVQNVDSDYNVLTKISTDFGETVLTLAQWQAQGRELHSVTGTPATLWVGSAGTDWHLLPTAPAVNKGVLFPSVTRDIEGRARPQGPLPDIGAYELGGTTPPPDTTAPAPPSGLALTPGNSQITLTWAANGEPDLAGYNVYRSTSQGGTYAKQNSALLTARTLTQTGLTNGQAYWYAVTAVDASGNESGQSTRIGATPTAPPDTTAPSAPSGLVLTPGNGQITAAWAANSEPDLAGYFVYRSTSQAGTYARQNTTPLTARTLTQAGLTNGQAYWYAVSAVDAAGNESALSAKVSATPTAPPDTTAPAPPSGLTLTAGDAQIAAAWNANSEPDLTGYNVYRSASQAGPYVKQNAAPLAAASLTQTGLTNGQAYWYAVTAVDTAGNESAQSAKVSAVPTAAPTTVSLVSVSFSPSTLRGGASTTGTVTLSAPAPAGGRVVTLTTTSSRVQVPGKITVPAGATSVNFTATTQRVSLLAFVTVRAASGGVTKSTTLTLYR